MPLNYQSLFYSNDLFFYRLLEQSQNVSCHIIDSIILYCRIVKLDIYRLMLSRILNFSLFLNILHMKSI